MRTSRSHKPHIVLRWTPKTRSAPRPEFVTKTFPELCDEHGATSADGIRAMVHRDLREHFERRFDMYATEWDSLYQDAWMASLQGPA